MLLEQIILPAQQATGQTTEKQDIVIMHKVKVALRLVSQTKPQETAQTDEKLSDEPKGMHQYLVTR